MKLTLDLGYAAGMTRAAVALSLLAPAMVWATPPGFVLAVRRVAVADLC